MSYEGSGIGKLPKLTLEGNYKEECLGWHKMTTFSETLMLFGHFEVRFEGSENGKLQKVNPKGNHKEKCLGWHKMTTFSGKPNAFGPF